MKIVIALDSFKGSLESDQACRIVRDAFLAVRPDLAIVIKPVADGGEGTAKAMLAARHGRWIPARVTGPLHDMQVDAGFAWFADTATALVEMAVASGLTLLSPYQLNPLKTTTFGTGELVKASLALKPRKILLAVGGSATTDCGIGAAAALGWQFLDNSGKPVSPVGGELARIEKILKPANLKLPPVEVLCDVTAPLTGPTGAAFVYGPQKGATPEMVRELDAGLAHLALLVRTQLHKEIETVPGAGAAGGLAAGAMAFMNARLVGGIETMLAACGLAADIADSDWVITGEGCFDHQSLQGKVVLGVSKCAAGSHARIGVLAGSVKLTADQYGAAGITDAMACKPPEMPLDQALAQAPQLLADAAKTFARKHFLNTK